MITLKLSMMKLPKGLFGGDVGLKICVHYEMNRSSQNPKGNDFCPLGIPVTLEASVELMVIFSLSGGI